MYNEEMRFVDFLEEPHVPIIKALTLQFQPTFLDILPLYIILLAAFPAILLVLRRRPALVFSLSLLLYAVVQFVNISVPAYPEGHVWYFNPLAWQFPFMAGAILGSGIRRRWLQPRGVLLFAAAGIAATTLIVKLSWTVHGVWDPFPGFFLKELWPVNKNNLSPIRLVPFSATVVLIAAFVSTNAGFLRGPVA